MEYKYYIEVDTMNGMETYYFKSNIKDLDGYLRVEMFREDIKKAISLQGENTILIGYWDFNDNYIEINKMEDSTNEK